MQRKRDRVLITPKFRGFKHFPHELIVLILSFLDLELKKLVIYRHVNKIWRDIIDYNIRRILENTTWTISLFQKTRFCLILGEFDLPINGVKIWTGKGGKVCQNIYRSLTGINMSAKMEEGKKLRIQKTTSKIQFDPNWIKCESVHHSNIEDVEGLIQYEIGDESNILLDDDPDTEFTEELGDYDLTKYRSEISDDDIYF